MKRNIKMLIAVIVVLALFAGGYFLLLKWEPESGEEETTPTQETESTEYLIDADTENIDYVQINNGTEVYKIKNTEKPSVEGYFSHVFDTDALSSAIYDMARISVSHRINIGMDKLSECGLDKETASVLVMLRDGTSRKVLIGSSANFEGEYYAMLEGGDYVCTIPSYEVETVMTSPSEYRSMDICSIDGNTIREFTIEKNGRKEISAKYDEDFVPANEYQTTSFLVTYPYSGVTASLDKIEALFTELTALTAESIVEENPKNLGKYGLDKPYVLSFKDAEGASTTVKMGNYGDGGSVYIMCNDLPVVYLAQCPFYEIVKESKASDYVERFINLFNIQTVASVEYKSGGEAHTLEIIEKGEEKYQYKKDGKLISEDKFKDVYQLIIGVTATDYVDAKPGGEEKCSITFNFTDKTSKTFTYYVYNERYSIVKGNNGMVCLALTKNLDNILNEFK